MASMSLLLESPLALDAEHGLDVSPLLQAEQPLGELLTRVTKELEVLHGAAWSGMLGANMIPEDAAVFVALDAQVPDRPA